MKTGNNKNMKYIIEQLNETSYLANFKCGVSTMDTFDNGRSENYAHAYADACNRGISEYCWDIQAQAYELAKTQGMDNDSASSFAYCCGDAWANGLSLGMKSFMERYNENWQRDF